MFLAQPKAVIVIVIIIILNVEGVRKSKDCPLDPLRSELLAGSRAWASPLGGAGGGRSGPRPPPAPPPPLAPQPTPSWPCGEVEEYAPSTAQGGKEV